MSPLSNTSLFILLLTCAAAPSSSLRNHPYPNPCDPALQPDPKTLRPDQLTVLINGYSESRIPLLLSIAAAYSSIPTVASVLVLWSNPNTSLKTLTLISQNLSSSSSSATISVIRHRSDSLNSRFLPRPAIRTRAVLICDDDIEIGHKTVELAFKLWRSDPKRVIGVFARSHDLDINDRSWIYTVHPDKYSMVLTKFMMTSSEYLFKYSCEGGEGMREARGVVDRMRNCEDVLMNFVVAEEAGRGPVLVGAEGGVRDWGDARNAGVEREGIENKMVGLSSRNGGHRKRRGVCIRDFHRILGRMPLRYSYGKVVEDVGEQGLCEKAGKLVLCDHSS